MYHSVISIICPANLSCHGLLILLGAISSTQGDYQVLRGFPSLQRVLNTLYLTYSRAIIGLTLFFIPQGPVLHYLMHNVLKTSLSYILPVFSVVLRRRLHLVTITSSWLEAADDIGTLEEFVKTTHPLGHTPTLLIYRL